MLNKVVWKPILGYEGIYEISNYGDVKSLRRYRGNGNGGYMQKERILKKTKTSTGYYKVELYKNKKRKSYKVHRLVAMAFIPNPHNKPNINHRDGNPLNNYVGNLEWCTQKENVKHALDVGLIPRKHIPIKKLKKLYYEDNKSIRDLEKIFKVSSTVIIDRLNKYGKGTKTISEGKTRYRLTKEFILSELKNKTQKQLAKEGGCSPSLISAYVRRLKERGDIYA